MELVFGWGFGESGYKYVTSGNRIMQISLLRIRIACTVILFFPYAPAFAGYQATGPIEASDCYDFGISVCSIKTVTEVRKDGRRYEINTYYEKVSEHNASTGMCFITTKSKGLGIFSWGINAATQPEFWGYDKSGKYGKIDAEYIRFRCIRR